MTGEDMKEARLRLGKMWGLGRPVSMNEMGLLLRLSGDRPSNSIRDYERGKSQISGPITLVIEMLLAGAKHPDA